LNPCFAMLPIDGGGHTEGPARSRGIWRKMTIASALVGLRPKRPR
jgi:hypothetical protein